MKVFKKFNSKTDKLLFSSDFHIDHLRTFIHEPRGFKSFEEHTNYLLKELYKLSYDTTLVYLGDFALNSSEERVRSILDTVKCNIIYINGNHCSYINKIIQKEKEQQFGITDKFIDVWPIRYKTTTFLGYCGAIAVDNQYIYLQHMAQYIWPYINENSIMLCGHSHKSCRELNPSEQNFGKILDCGVEHAL
jgi:calcineurin-like phosphoesterase family protein